MVLDGLCRPPFEPLQEADLRPSSLETVLLLALALAKRVSGIHALSAHPSCTQFTQVQSRVLLKANSAYVPKVICAYYLDSIRTSAFTIFLLMKDKGYTCCVLFVFCVLIWTGLRVSEIFNSNSFYL